MKFSTRAEYGLRALSCLDKTGRHTISLAEISERQGLSLAYLERLFAKLKSAKIVRSERGQRGGYCLARPARRVSLLEVLTALEDSFVPYDCVTRKNHSACVCGCTLNPVWRKIYSEMNKVLQKIKLSEIIR